jgi:hypothetical protein
MGLEWDKVHYYCGHLLACCTGPGWLYGDNCGALSGMNEWYGKPTYWEETCPSSPLSTTVSTLPELEPGPPLLQAHWDAKNLVPFSRYPFKIFCFEYSGSSSHSHALFSYTILISPINTYKSQVLSSACESRYLIISLVNSASLHNYI